MEFTDIQPKDFISFEILRNYLPLFVHGDHDEISLDNLANFLAKDLIIKYAKELENETK